MVNCHFLVAVQLQQQLRQLNPLQIQPLIHEQMGYLLLNLVIICFTVIGPILNGKIEGSTNV